MYFHRAAISKTNNWCSVMLWGEACNVITHLFNIYGSKYTYYFLKAGDFNQILLEYLRQIKIYLAEVFQKIKSLMVKEKVRIRKNTIKLILHSI